MAAIRLENISKMYRIYDRPRHKLKEAILRGLLRSRRWTYHREFWALRNVNLEVNPGETFGVVGRNGSGKSTLLQIIAGVLQPTTGNLNVKGRVVALLELGAGFNREFTGRENVFMNGAILGISRKEMERHLDEIEAFADIGSFIDQPVKIYSSGMYVRLAFATAVNVDPDILIVDEALAVGDDIFRRRCYQKIEEFQRKGKTIFFVSHALQLVKSLCSRAMLIEEGQITEIGSPNKIVHLYNDLISNLESSYSQKKMSRSAGNRKNDSFQNLQKAETEGIVTEHRYGNGGAEVVSFALLNKEGNEISIAEFGETYRVSVTVRFDRDVDNPEIGMRMTTITGIAVTGITTGEEGITIGPVKGGETITVEFQFNMRLKPDTYTLSVGVSELMLSGETVALDRRMDAMIFKVLGGKKFMGLVDMNFNIHIVDRSSEKRGVPQG